MKTTKMPRIKSSEQRLRIIDRLLSGKAKISNREKLLDLVNREIEDPIGVEMLDKDLAELRMLAQTEDVDLRWTKTNGYRYTEPDYRYFQKALTDDEKLMLVLAQNLFQTFRQTSLKEKFRDLLDKVIANDGSTKFWNESKTQRFIQPEWDNESPGNKWLPDLIQAIFEKKQITITYNRNKKNLSPYVLKQNKGIWYLVAYDHDKQNDEAVKIYSLNRIQQILPGRLAYHLDPGFRPDDYFKYSLGIWHRYDSAPVPVVLEFREHHLIEFIAQHKIHPSQQILRQNHRTIRIQLTVFDSIELENLILGFGDSVKLISPRNLKIRLREKIKKLAELYD